MTEDQMVAKLIAQGHSDAVIELARTCWLIGHTQGIFDCMLKKNTSETVQENMQRLVESYNG